MAVDLVDLVGSLERAVNPPGADFYPNTHVSEWRDRLADAFWDGRLAGFFVGFTCVDGVVTRVNAGKDLDRMMQQIIVQYAATTSLKGKLVQLATTTRYKAGPIEAETQRSATVLLELLKQANAALAQLRADLSDNRAHPGTAFLDTIVVSNHRFLDRFGGWMDGPHSWSDGPYGWVN